MVALAALLAAGALSSLPVAPASHGSFRCPLDVGFVLDRSTSMAGLPMTLAETGGQALVDQLGTADRSGVRSFPDYATDKAVDGDHAATRTGLTAGVTAVSGVRTATDQGPAMNATRADLNAVAGGVRRQIMIVLTDGINPNTTAAADAAKADGIEVFAVAIGSGADVAHMYWIASLPKADHFKWVTTAAEAQTAMDEIMDTVLSCAPIPDFDWVLECAGLPVTFNDLTLPATGAGLLSTTWDYGDGSADYLAPPPGSVSHTFPGPGTYTVNLTVEDAVGINESIEQEIGLPPCPKAPPVAAFQCRSSTDPYLLVRFQDLSTDAAGGIVTWKWDFGDGWKSSEQHPEHAYHARGAYAVTLTVTDGDGATDSVTRACRALLERPPVLEPLEDIVVYEGETVSFRLVAADPDGDPLTYLLASGSLPGGALTGPEFAWRTHRGSAGFYGPLAFGVTDGVFLRTTTVHITVLEAAPERGPGAGDGDGDGAADGRDNCPSATNPDQADSDGDGMGDACDPSPGAPPAPAPSLTTPQATPTTAPAPTDGDGDGLPDEADLCPLVFDPDQADLDGDGRGDLCDDDPDGDRVPTRDDQGAVLDVCPEVHDPLQADADGDGVGDLCDEDVCGSDCGPAGPPMATARVSRPAVLPWIAGAVLVALLAVALPWVLRRRAPKD